MSQIREIHFAECLHSSVLLVSEKSEVQKDHHQPTLEDIQRRAYRIHHEHGGVSGGYTLDDWLEAEHELEEKQSPARKKDRVH